MKDLKEPDILGHLVSRVIAWIILPLYLVGMGCFIWLGNRLGQETTVSDLMLAVGFGAFAAVGALLVSRRPENAVSWIMGSIGLMTALFPAFEIYAAYVMITRGTPDLLAVFGVWANELYWIPLLALALVYLPLLFPDGHLLSPRWWWVAWTAGLAAAGFVITGAFRETLTGQNIAYQIENPIGIAGAPSAEESPLFAAFLAGMMVGLIGAVASVIIRFRRSRGIERQQLKWFLYSIALYPVLLFTDQLPVLGDLLFGLILILLPAAVGIAVLRYRLYDIDIIIRRTLQYTLLTVALALLYFGLVTLLQALSASVFGLQSPVVIVLSTLIIAALFNPLRIRIQNLIDRRFYRKKYDAEKALAKFAEAARSETNLECLNEALLEVVQETVQPERVSIWLRK
jgi:hypothetical protein